MIGKVGDEDLFGNPFVPLRDRRGRPAYKKTKENQDFVSVRAAAGWSHLRIAEALGCNDDTLRKHFSGELENGAMIVEGVMLDVLMLNVRRGHVPSVRALRDQIKTAAPKAPTKKVTDIKDPVGKKLSRVAEAQEVPDGYGDLYAKMRKN